MNEKDLVVGSINISSPDAATALVNALELSKLKKENSTLLDLLKRFYNAADEIDRELCSEEKTMGGERYDELMDVFIEVEKYLGLE